ncbi:MAG TPA: S8 family serine peptidase, partial [Verrucomicrobiae bacterium]|nr:S8 family serine peptidase [Verrucomicrobiae bacterium]
MSSPAVGKNVIAAGASQGPRTNFFDFSAGPEALASFSSRGPCEDGRFKPDLIAPGTWVASLLSSLAPPENAAGPINNEFVFLNGTSQAAPHISAAAAVFIQYYRSTFYGATPSPALVKAALINTAVDLAGESLSAGVPNMDEGWGRANVAALVRSDRVFEFLDQSSPLAQDGTFQRSVIVTRTNVPLKITMAYTDFPGFPAAVPALVNNLDLELTAPDGRTYRGNQFALGESVAGAQARDAINNVEAIHLARPLRGEYILRVTAQSVRQDSRLDTGGPDQDFALAISGGIPSKAESIIVVNRPTYGAGGQINIKLLEPDLLSEPSVVVRASSQLEDSGEPVTLLRATAGVFTGSITTASGSPVSGNGLLEIAHTNWIRVEYFDPSLPGLRAAMATADLLPPGITNVGYTFAFGQLVVTWSTDEPASSWIRYGTSPDALNLAATNSSLTTTHVVELNGLMAGQTYYYMVMSTDGAGNAAANNNGGSLFTFTTGMNATVLLVDAYEADPFDDPIHLSTYTDPLSEIGIHYDVWSYSALGTLPNFDALRPYPVVIWRINDSFRRPDDSIPPTQQDAIRQYLDAGGSLFLASMEILSRLLNQGATPFVTNVLHVQRFVRSPNPFEHCTNCNEDFRVPAVRGVSNDPIGREMNVTLDYLAYDESAWLGPDYGDTFTPSTNASPVLLEAASRNPCAMRFPRTGQDSPSRVVFASVPLDAFPATGPFPNRRTEFLRRAIQFLAPGVGGVGTLALNQAVYSLPDLITIELADADLERAGSAVVSVYSESRPLMPITVTLTETIRPGLFRGAVAVNAPGGSSTPGNLEAIDGDIIHVEYLDASMGAPIEATVRIDDTNPQRLGDVEIKAGFMD